MKKKKSNGEISVGALMATLIIVIMSIIIIYMIVVNSSGKEAYRRDISQFKNSLTIYLGEQYISEEYNFQLSNLNGVPLEEILPQAAMKYAGKFTIKNGKIIGTQNLTEEEKAWLAGIIE